MKTRAGTRLKTLWLGLGLLLWSLPLVAAPAETSPLGTAIAPLLRAPLLKNSQVGIEVRSLKRKQTLYEKNAYQALNPASTLKIVTTKTALDELKPHYRFKTRFSTNRFVGEGVVDNLYVQGGGDPYFVIERLWRVAGDLQSLGVKEVRGAIVVDNSFFDDKFFTDGWPEEPGSQAYYAPTSAFAVNFNTVSILVRPGSHPGEPAHVVLEPQVPSVELQATVKTGSSTSGKNIAIEKIARGNQDIFRVSGQIPLHSPPYIKYRNVSNPLRYSGEVFKLVLENRGITVKGGVLTGKVPNNDVELFVEESPPLSTLIKEVNKLSNNFMAETILKTLAAQRFGAPGTTEKGAALLTTHLTNLGVAKNEIHIENGSGLSRDTRISAHALVAVLEEAWNDPTSGPEYLSSFALAGADGTAERRHIQNVRAKTGSLNGVSTICGYLSRRDGDLLAFCILMNNVPGGYGSAHDIQDDIILRISESKE